MILEIDKWITDYFELDYLMMMLDELNADITVQLKPTDFDYFNN